ncbi:hypothetical protein QTJ16_000279 [Diplocarpon rosae]|uniref:Uncharacterized protein n=1 Tax=Diplocarpon rosae TaxID=946125 RepID=A0AAD9T676_9HELO|nr:hypothetical protein QTJ16_000279 [Diplocarpon rosae]
MATILFPEFSKAPGISSSPTRPKHLSTRPIPDVSAPPSKGHHKHHYPHTHHRSGRDKDKDRDRERERKDRRGRKDGEGLNRSEAHTPNESRVASRRGSLGLDGLGGGVSVGGDIGWIRRGMERERRVRDGEVEEERERGVLRARFDTSLIPDLSYHCCAVSFHYWISCNFNGARKEIIGADWYLQHSELRSALTSLTSLSNATTRQLDTAYYSVLEKVSALHSTIASLSELASLTRGLTEEFSTETQELVADVSTQVEGFAGFEDQEQRIGDLKQRVERGREKIKSLGDRVEIVRDRVEGWEIREKEWQDRTRRRLRALWVGFVIVLAALGVGVAIQWTPGTRSQSQMKVLGMHGEGNPSGLLGKLPDSGAAREALKNESQRRKMEVKKRIIEGTKEAEDDPRLRIFDEL